MPLIGSALVRCRGGLLSTSLKTEERSDPPRFFLFLKPETQMPIRITNTAAAGTSYIDVRIGEGHTIHQQLLDVSDLYDDVDADGYLPPGLGITATGTLAHESGTTTALIGPEPVYIGLVTSTVDVFGNVILAGGVNLDAIADNVGAALAAAPANIIAR